MKKAMKVAAISAATLVALLTTSNASVIISGTFDGTYTASTLNNVAFIPDAGKLYGVSAALNLSTMPWAANDKSANNTLLNFNSTPGYGIGQSWYSYGGNVYRFLNVQGGGGNLDLGRPTGPIYSGFSLDTRASTWTVAYYYGGTGFDANSVYQGATAFRTLTGISPFAITQINFSYQPYDAPAGSRSSVVSDFKVTAIPEPSTWLLLAGSLTVMMLLRRRRSMV